MTLDRTIAPSVSDFGHLTIPSPTEIILGNGVRLVVINNGEQPVNMIAVTWNGGYDDVEKPEALKLMCSTLNEGCKSFDSETIADILDFNGSWLKIGSSGHHTSIRLYSLNSRLKEVLPVIREIIISPTFPVEAVEAKSKKLISALKLDLEKVSYIASRLSDRLILGKNNRGARTETSEQYEAITGIDLERLHSQIIVGNRPTIYLAGNISEETIRIVSDTFGNIAFGSDGCVITLSPPSPDLTPCREDAIMPDKLQCAIKTGCPAISRTHPDYDYLRIAVTALGGYFGSRLSMNIREEKGFTYGISAGLLGTLDGSMIRIGCQCDNAFVEPVLDEISKELNLLASVPMEKEELDAVRRYQMSMLASTLDNPINIADYYINMKTVGTPDDYFYRQQRALNSVTPEQIMELTARYMSPESMYTAVAGSL